MERRALGFSELDVPVVGVGTWRTFQDLDRRRLDVGPFVTEALGAAANLFDSSPMYGPAERLLGESLEGRRDQAIIGTKVWASLAIEGRRQIERALGYF